LESSSSHKAAPFLNGTRRAIDRDEVMQIPQSRVESLLSAALATAVVIFCTYLAWLLPSRHAISV